VIDVAADKHRRLCEKTRTMIIEHALLTVRAGREAEFVEAVEGAKSIIASSPGFIDLTVSRGIESPSTFLLLVRWETLESHTVGFRQSAAYQEWKRLLHHFYDPFPVVEHFVPTISAP
jgi:heme-degrading monooxygenase HmoA